MLLKYMDSMFADMSTAIECVMQSSDNGVLMPIEAHRQAMDKISLKIHVKSMQLEVFRRAIESNQDELNTLVEERSSLLMRANTQFTSKSLPTLPIETIAQIFSYLYWMEDGVSLIYNNNKTTLQRLLADSGASVGWRNLIHSQIPIQVTIANSYAHGRELANPNLGGLHPRTFLTHQLNDITADILNNPSTTIFAHMSEWQKLEEGFESIRQFPWRKLVIVLHAGSESPEKKTEILKTFILNFGRKLADLDHLEFYLIPDNIGVLLDAGALARDLDAYQILAPKLRVARLLSQMLPGLRPILSNITVLRVEARTSSHPISLGDVFLERLEPYSSNLISLTLTIFDASGNRRRFIHTNNVAEAANLKPRERRASFPRLKQLKLESFAEYLIQDVVSAVDCPSLSHFSFTTKINQRNDRIQVALALLHTSFPKLECIAMSFGNTSRDAQFLAGLATPDGSGSWLLPALSSIEFSFKTVDFSLLKTLTRVVLNRLSSGATKSIHSIFIARLEGLPHSAMRADINTLRLLVPEVIIKFDSNGGRW